MDSIKNKRINIISFSENETDIQRITEILESLGLQWNIVTRYDLYENVYQAEQAFASIALNEQESGYFAEQLKKEYGVPYIYTDLPIGTVGIRNFIHQLKVNLMTQDYGNYELDGLEKINPYIKRQVLRGQKVYLNLGMGKVKMAASLVKELGGQVVGMLASRSEPYTDSVLAELRESHGGMEITVSDHRSFELYRALSRSKADIYITDQNDFSLLNGISISVMCVKNVSLFGFQGIYDFHSLAEKTLFAKEHVNWTGVYFHPVYRQEWIMKPKNM